MLSLSLSLSKSSFQHSYQHQIPPVALLIFPPFYLCLFFCSSFWTNPVRLDLITTTGTQEKNKENKSFSDVKNVDRLTSLQHAAIRNLLLCTFQLLFSFFFLFYPLGHCRHIFLYSFGICSTVNYQLYIILEERRRAGVKQQSHQSLWLHNSCHPYSNKIYHIVNHQDANVRRSVYVCARRSADNSEVIN